MEPILVSNLNWSPILHKNLDVNLVCTTDLNRLEILRWVNVCQFHLKQEFQLFL